MSRDGLQKQLASDHPVIVWFRGTLNLTHGANSNAAKNYLANVSRVLYAVTQWMLSNGRNVRHWSELFTVPVEAYKTYLDK